MSRPLVDVLKVAMSNRPKTLKDVSQAASLSLITVSRAMRHPETVRAETRAKVERAIREIGYVPNLTARSLVSKRSNMVGLVVPLLSSSLFADLAQGVTATLQRENRQLLLGVSNRSPDAEADAVRTFIGRQADAVILTGFTHSQTCRAMLSEFQGPIVETWNLRKEAIDLAVGYDNARAAADMTNYLIQKGYREIALVGGEFENNDQAIDRHYGFVEAMRAAGLSVRPEFVIPLTQPTTLESGYRAIEALLALRPTRPEAVFFHAELPAHGAMMACLARGIDVPGDIAIAGFGDLRLSALLPVPLTTVHIKSFEIGETAGRLIVDRLEGRADDSNQVDLGYDLVVRRSA